MRQSNRELSVRRSGAGRSSRASFRSGLSQRGLYGTRINSIRVLRNAAESARTPPASRSASGVLSLVLDRDPVAECRVDGAVSIASKVDGFVHHLLVKVPRPPGDEGDFDLGKPTRPFLFLLAFHLDLERREWLLELLEQENGVESGAAAEGAQQHLGGPHRGVVAEDRRLVDAGGVARGRLDVELDLVPAPACDC